MPEDLRQTVSQSAQDLLQAGKKHKDAFASSMADLEMNLPKERVIDAINEATSHVTVPTTVLGVDVEAAGKAARDVILRPVVRVVVKMNQYRKRLSQRPLQYLKSKYQSTMKQHVNRFQNTYRIVLLVFVVTMLFYAALSRKGRAGSGRPGSKMKPGSTASSRK